MSIFTNESPELLALTDPTLLQVKVLEDMEAKLNVTDNEHRLAIVDPHSVFNYLLEMNSVLTSEFALAAHQELSSQHAKRALTSEDLYRHMSDFDYVNLFSTPAPMKFKVTFDKNFFYVHAKDFNNNYKKVVIPKNTVIKIGKYPFGIHYPIEIRINSATKDAVAIYDTTKTNPLQNLTTNIIDLYEHQSFMGQELITLIIPTQQFARQAVKETLVPGHGFTKTYSYNNHFYALRAFTDKNGQMVELAQTLANNVYDPYTPTIRLYLEKERNKLKLNIPQVYFNTNQMGPNLYLEFFTTFGALDIDVSNSNAAQSAINFNMKDSGISDISYSQVLLKSPTNIIIPDSTKIAGGSNGYGFTEMRQRTIHNSFHTEVAVTRLDLDNRFLDNGYNVMLHKDNFTERIYFAYRLLTDGNGDIVHTKEAPVLLTENSPSETSTILTNMDKSITILPTTLYKYNAYTNVCLPLTDAEVAFLNTLNKQQLCDELNGTIYTKSPFHIRTITDPKYGRATSYNMMNPTVDKFVFDKENLNTVSQMTTAGGYIKHKDEGTGGYEVHLLVKKTQDLVTIPETGIYIYVYTMADEGVPVGTKAEYIGMYGNDHWVYKFDINTDYWIDENHSLNVTNLFYNDEIFSHAVPLTATFHVIFMVDGLYLPGITADMTLYEGVPINSIAGNIALIRQHFELKMGDILTDVIYNDIDFRWSDREYLRHQVDVPLTYPEDIYEKDANGVTVFTIDANGDVILNLIHAIGDTVYDDNGDVIFKHRAGDVILEDGNPVPVKDNVLTYYLNAIMIDAKVYASEHPDQINYISGITGTLMTYLNYLLSESKHLLEQTELYFRPINTIGNGKFNIGNEVPVILPLASSYSLRVHVPKYIVQDEELQSTIRNNIISIIEDSIVNSTKSGERISMTEIADIIANTLNDYIYSVDVLGINGKKDLQTMTPINEHDQPSIATRLVINKDGIIVFEKDVDVEFVVK